MILISFLLCLIPSPNSLFPLTGILTTLTQMCFINHFHPVHPHLTVYVLSMKFRYWLGSVNSPVLSPQKHPGALRNAAGGTMTRDIKQCCHFQPKQRSRRGDRLWYLRWSPSQGALSQQGHRYDCPKVDLTTEEDKDAGLVSSLRSFAFVADRLKRTAPQAVEMGQALVTGHHTVKKSTEGENL